MATTGWQAHSVRGFVSGTLGKQRDFLESLIEENHDRAIRLALWPAPVAPR
jgi:hypothetical protein